MNATLMTWYAVFVGMPNRWRARDQRGDVPGWVLITVMTAGLVAALWAVAGPALSQMLRDALSSVKS
jgi:hypothetical protein